MAGKRIAELPVRGLFDSACNLPVEPVPAEDPDVTNRVTAEQVSAFVNARPFTGVLRNVGLAASADTGALTIELKQTDGVTDPSAASVHSVVEAMFRPEVPTSGARERLVFDEPLSITIPSGATLGFENGEDAKVFVYLYRSSDSRGLAVCSEWKNPEEPHALVTISDAADEDGTIYSDAFDGDAGLVCIGYVQVSAIATAGTWTTPDLLFAGELRGTLPVSAGFQNPATEDLTLGAFNLLRSGSNGVWSVLPSAGVAGIEAAMEAAAAAGGGEVQLAGVYDIDEAISPAIAGLNGVKLKGAKGTVLLHDGSGTFPILSLNFSGSPVAIDALAATDTEFTTTTPSDASQFAVGDAVKFEGAGEGDFEEGEANEVAIAGNGTTGVVGLKFPIRRAITGVTARRLRDGKNIEIENIRFSIASPIEEPIAVLIQGSRNCVIRNCVADSFQYDGWGAFNFNNGWGNLVEYCQVADVSGYGIRLTGEFESDVRNCSIVGCDRGVGLLTRSHDSAIEFCRITNCEKGILIDGSSGSVTRRVRVSRNKISEILLQAIQGFQLRNSDICDNMIDRAAQGGPGEIAIDISGHVRSVKVAGNHIKASRIGIVLFGTAGELCSSIIANNVIEESHGGVPAAEGINSGGDGNLVIGNVVTAIAECCIAAGQGSHQVIANNVCIGSVTAGIEIYATVSDSLITGNVMRDNATYAILLANTVTEMLVSNNVLGGGGVADGGSATNIFIGNKP